MIYALILENEAYQPGRWSVEVNLQLNICACNRYPIGDCHHLRAIKAIREVDTIASYDNSSAVASSPRVEVTPEHEDREDHSEDLYPCGYAEERDTAEIEANYDDGMDEAASEESIDGRVSPPSTTTLAQLKDFITRRGAATARRFPKSRDRESRKSPGHGRQRRKGRPLGSTNKQPSDAHEPQRTRGRPRGATGAPDTEEDVIRRSQEVIDLAAKIDTTYKQIDTYKKVDIEGALSLHGFNTTGLSKHSLINLTLDREPEAGFPMYMTWKLHQLKKWLSDNGKNTRGSKKALAERVEKYRHIENADTMKPKSLGEGSSLSASTAAFKRTFPESILREFTRQLARLYREEDNDVLTDKFVQQELCNKESSPSNLKSMERQDVVQICEQLHNEGKVMYVDGFIHYI